MKNASIIGSHVVLIASTWLLAIEGTATAQTVSQASYTRTTASDKEVQRLLTELSDTGAKLVAAQSQEQIVRYSLRQADVLARLSDQSRLEERPALIQQMAESLCTAVQCSPENDHAAQERLVLLEQLVEQAQPGSALAASITFLEMQAEYETSRNAAGKIAALASRQRCVRLTRFAEKYPDAAQTPDALLELAGLYKANGQPDKARTVYLVFAHRFPRHVQAVKVRREARWLELPGQTEFLVLPVLFTEDERLETQFDIEQLRGHVALVYFWESKNPQCVADMRTLGALQARYQDQGLEIVYVNLDKDPAQARAFVQEPPAAGVHVSAHGAGVAAALVERFGLASTPRLLVLGKDGGIAGEAVAVQAVEAQVSEQLKQPAVLVTSGKEIGRRFPWTR
jgi:thiol-disulfide isomerase/thioredoxin